MAATQAGHCHTESFIVTECNYFCVYRNNKVIQIGCFFLIFTVLQALILHVYRFSSRILWTTVNSDFENCPSARHEAV